MTCRDFQRICDELLDADADLAHDGDGDGARLAAHAAECPSCRAIEARYQLLQQAIRAWRQPPAPSPAFVDRILVAAQTEPAIIPAAAGRPWPMNRDGLRIVAGLAATALVGVILAGLLPRAGRVDHAVSHPPVVDRTASPPRVPSPSFNRALAEATSATWDLARSTSEPAARLGREVLDAGEDEGAARPAAAEPTATAQHAKGLASLSVPVPSLEPLAPDASAVLQQVGDQISAGVRPISSTARQAFGFLLGPDRRPASRAGAAAGSSSS